MHSWGWGLSRFVFEAEGHGGEDLWVNKRWHAPHGCIYTEHAGATGKPILEAKECLSLEQALAHDRATHFLHRTS